ncbi:hypothetical protein [uncultured Bradyrhizobium sp.]|uniref:hypothetical protein n=1 Tax=uncultured Bradyrhizobium sp. TaxID=199684 RepID=UPI0026050CB7|nr:hypothetical protein [uncultured Bradyrhizobium sp.]
MRQMIKGLIAAVAVMLTAPAMACGFNPCGAPVYAAPAVTYGCGGCGGYGYGYGYAGYGAVERLPDPDAAYPNAAQQYYYVNQGPTYSGPGNWAPRPYYREGYGRPYYGYRHYGYRHYGYRHSYRPYRAHYGYRYGYAHRAPAYHYGHRVLRRYY